jgi:hypothetical protein
MIEMKLKMIRSNSEQDSLAEAVKKITTQLIFFVLNASLAAIPDLQG